MSNWLFVLTMQLIKSHQMKKRPIWGNALTKKLLKFKSTTSLCQVNFFLVSFIGTKTKLDWKISLPFAAPSGCGAAKGFLNRSRTVRDFQTAGEGSFAQNFFAICYFCNFQLKIWSHVSIAVTLCIWNRIQVFLNTLFQSPFKICTPKFSIYCRDVFMASASHIKRPFYVPLSESKTKIKIP